MAKRPSLLDEALEGLPATRPGVLAWYGKLEPDLLRETEEVADAWLRGEIAATKTDFARWLEKKLRAKGIEVRYPMIVRWLNTRSQQRPPQS